MKRPAISPSTITNILPTITENPSSDASTTPDSFHLDLSTIENPAKKEIHYFYSGFEYKGKIQTWQFPFFSLTGQVQGHYESQIEFLLKIEDTEFRFIAVLDFDGQDYLDPITQPGIVKTARFRIVG